MTRFSVGDERFQAGLFRLLNAPRDLVRWDADVGDPGFAGAGENHRILFGQYLRDLEATSRAAADQWLRDIEWNTQALGDRQKSIETQWMTFPAGPASNPVMVALVRRYWLGCDALNRQSPPAARVAPEAFMLSWVVEQRGPGSEIAHVIACMPYWPLGQDDEGNWC